MFNGNVNLINKKNSKVTHVGFRMDGYMVTGCKLEWNIDAKVTEGEASQVTCKRCKKLLERADENGNVVIGPARKWGRTAMRSYLDIVIDVKDGKEVSKQELGLALLFANDQLFFANKDVDRCINGEMGKGLIKALMIKNREERFNCRKNPIDKWFGNNIPIIK